MTTLSLIINPASGGGAPEDETDDIRAQIADALEALRDAPHVDAHETTEAGDAQRLARQLTDDTDGPHTLFVAGGDGTLNDALQGLRDADWEELTLGLIPTGTGNDFAGTAGIDLERVPDWLQRWADDPDAATEGWARRAFDLIEATTGEGATRVAINAVTGGASAAVADALEDEHRQRFGPLAYARAAVDTARRVRPPDVEADDTLAWDVHVELEDGRRESATILGLVVAGGSTAGGGWRVAPHASPRDGILDVLLYLAPSSRLQLPGWLAQLAGGDVTQHDHVVSLRTRALTLRSDDALPLRADGEPLPCDETARFSVLPEAVYLWTPEGEG